MMFAVPAEPYEVSPDDRARDEPAPHPARRPRAELLDVDGAAGRLERGEPLRVDRGRHLRALGPAARRREPGSHRDARAASATTAATSRSTSRRPRTRTTRSGSGLRPPRLQELRPAREDPQGSRRQGAPASSASGDELLDIALKLEEVALNDEYFIERKLYPNVDFYSGIIYRAMGFPTNMFTVLFALGRLPGWIAHWKEMIEDPKTKIGRPRQIYTGPTLRTYVPDRPARLSAAARPGGSVRVDLTPTAGEARLRAEVRGVAARTPALGVRQGPAAALRRPRRRGRVRARLAGASSPGGRLGRRAPGRRSTAGAGRARSSTSSSPRSWRAPARPSSSAASASTSSGRRCSRTARPSRRRAGCPDILDASRALVPAVQRARRGQRPRVG